MPNWFPLVRAARYLGVPPWELARQPVAWMSWALTAERAESEGEQIAFEIARQRDELSE